MASLLVVDDDNSVREVLREFVEICCPEISVIGEATNGREAVESAEAMRPDLILMDVRMPVLDGIQATRRIKQELQLPSVVVTFTSFHQPEIVEEARRAGASYHVRKPFALDDLRDVLLGAAGLRGAS